MSVTKPTPPLALPQKGRGGESGASPPCMDDETKDALSRFRFRPPPLIGAPPPTSRHASAGEIRTQLGSFQATTPTPPRRHCCFHESPFSLQFPRLSRFTSLNKFQLFLSSQRQSVATRRTVHRKKQNKTFQKKKILRSLFYFHLPQRGSPPTCGRDQARRRRSESMHHPPLLLSISSCPAAP